MRRLCPLEQVFHRYGTALRYIVEVKSSPGLQMGTMARRIAKLVSVFGVERRVVVGSFDAEFLKRMREAERLAAFVDVARRKKVLKA